jgi:putative ABC transport system substrate-binding protein
MPRRSAGLVDRSAFILALLLGLLASGSAFAQSNPQAKRVAVLFFQTSSAASGHVAIFEERLRDNGFETGKNVAIDYRFAERSRTKVVALATEIAGMQPNVFVAIGTSASIPAFQAIKRRKPSEQIPLVFVSSDPLEHGLVSSLARPGGFATGLSAGGIEATAKRLELFKEALSQRKQKGPLRIAVLLDSSHPARQALQKALDESEKALQIALERVECASIDDYVDGIRKLASAVDGYYITNVPSKSLERANIASTLRTTKKPFVYSFGNPEDDGALLSYNADQVGSARRAADYVARILNGAKPAIMPVQVPARYSLIVNRAAAEKLRISLPKSLLAFSSSRDE